MRLLSADRSDALRRQPFTYPEVGATRSTLPNGYHVLDRERVLHRRDFDAAVADLMSWQLQTRAGFGIEVSDDRVREGAVVVMRLGVGPFAIEAPCRVVYVMHESDRRGFAYGTLSGHPESGEEAFVLTRTDDGLVALTITAFSRPATALTTLAGPAGRMAQSMITRRYLRALDRRDG